MDFEAAKRTATKKLGDRLDQVRAARDPGALEVFAKAYLGLFLDIDEAVAPPQRVAMLAEPDIAEAVLEGFIAILRRDDLPDPATIGTALGEGRRYAKGYVVLAGMDRLAQQGLGRIHALEDTVLASALCFHYANTPSQSNAWEAEVLVHHPDLMASTLRDFWQGQYANASDTLPGLAQVMKHPGARPVLEQVILQLLHEWQNCSTRQLMQLLQLALQCGERQELLELAGERLREHREGDVKRHIYWLATGYLLAPQQFQDELAGYVGHYREKALPLLDFTVEAMQSDDQMRLRHDADVIAHLLRLLAPLFRRNQPSTGGLDANAQKVLWLFDQLAADSSESALAAVERLRNVRVMGIYDDVLEDVARRQRGAVPG